MTAEEKTVSGKAGVDREGPDDHYVKTAAGGDRGAFDELVSRHQQSVINAAAYYLGNYEDALEVAQRAMAIAARLQNQPRLAAAIGKTVGDRLLTVEDLTQTFTDETFRGAFDDRLAEFLDRALNTERAALRELIPERVMPDIEVLLDEGIGKALIQLDTYLESVCRQEESRWTGMMSKPPGVCYNRALSENLAQYFHSLEDLAHL